MSADASLQHLPFARRFIRTCMDGWHFGWHEANGGNLSYRLAEDEAAQVRDVLGAPQNGPTSPSAEYILVTASGCFFRNMEQEFESCAGIIARDSEDGAWQPVWGFAGGSRPTSELGAHLAAFAARSQARVVYHAHTPYTVALSHVLGPDAALWCNTLAKTITEFTIYLPEGITVLPVMTPGTSELARATAQALMSAPVCVWSGHGTVSTAPTLDAAFGQTQVLEKTAQIYLTANACRA